MRLELTAFVLAFALGSAVAADTRAILNLNADWQFHLCKHEPCTIGKLPTADWEAVRIPHTWNAKDGQDGGNDYFRGVGWYRRTIAAWPDSRHVRHFIRFKAASLIADVFVDGHHVGQHRGGFAAFCFEITEFVGDFEPHELTVRVDNRKHDDVMPLSGDFTKFGGIYRDVELISTPAICITPRHFASAGVYVTPISVTAAEATIEIAALLDEHRWQIASVRADIRDSDGKSLRDVVLRPSGRRDGFDEYRATVQLKKPRRWNGKAGPSLYQVRVEVRNPALAKPLVHIDTVTVPFGLRSFRVDPETGFYLNGKPLNLHGVSRHQDRLDKGWAISRADMEKDFQIIGELGCTMVRLAHYQHDDYAYELADRAGLVVWAEIPLIDKITESDAFLQNAKQQLRELIYQNINHPSICFWGIHNEVTAPWKLPAPDPTTVVKELNAVAKEADPSRLTVTAACDPPDHPANWQTDLTAFNLYFGWYGGEPDGLAKWCDGTHAAHPKTPLGISEYGAGASIHHHEWPPKKPQHDGPHHPEEWQTYLHERQWEIMKERPYLWCEIVWNGFDFAVDTRKEGDTAGRNDKGLVTIDRKTRKDAWYYYQAQWSEKPIVHISHAARDAVGPSAPIRIYSNCDSVSLLIDNRVIAEFRDFDGVISCESVDLPKGTYELVAVGKRVETTVRDTSTISAVAAESN